MNTKKQVTMLIVAQCCILLLYQGARAAEFPVTESASPEDMAVAQALFDGTKTAKASGRSFTQTQAHLSLPATQQKINYMAGLAKNKAIITETQKREVALKNYYVFYTAIPYMRLFQDVVRKMYKNSIGRPGGLAAGKKAFQFVRFNYKDPTYNQYKNATDFLLRETKQNGLIDDNEVRLKTILVSTNLALLGNAGFTGESTWYFFNNPQPWGTVNQGFIESAMGSYGYSLKFLPEVMDLLTYLKDEKGNLSSDLFQIFIPNRTIANEIGYLSWRLGIPFDTELIPKSLGLETMTFGVGDKLSYLVLKEKVANFRTKYQNRDPVIGALVEQWLSNISKGKYHISEFLDKYKSAPASIRIANYAQGRLLITNDTLLNPASGILIYRYSTLDPKKETVYKQKLSDLFMKMEFERKRRLNIPATPAIAG